MRLALFMLVVAPVFGASVSVGVNAGVPVAETVRAASEIGGLPFHSDILRFTVGPVLDIRLPRGLGVEFGAMYKRFDQHAGQVQVIAEPGIPYEVQIRPYSRAGQSWEFPILGQYRLPGTAIRPYVEAGLSFNHLSGVFAPFRTLASQSTILAPGGISENRRGIVIGAGLDIKLPFMRVVPGLRYTHYGNTQWFWLPSANAIDFLVGLKF